MKSFTQSDIFQIRYNKNDVLMLRVQKILSGKANGLVILNDELESDLKKIKKIYNNKTTLDMIEAVRTGKIRIFCVSPEDALPSFLPFVKYQNGSEWREMVDVSRYVRITKGEINTYEIDHRQLYSLLLSAYIDLKICLPEKMLPSAAMSPLAILWAKMFAKVLQRCGLATNNDRYRAFVWFGMKFFLINMASLPYSSADSYTKKVLGENNQLVKFMLEKMENRGIKEEEIYTSFERFTNVIFNNEISNVRGMRINNVQEVINSNYYVNKFIDTFYNAAVLSLASPNYFIFTMISAVNDANIVNQKTIKDLIADDKKEWANAYTALIREM